MNWTSPIVNKARAWIIRQLTLGEFDSHRHVWTNAVVMACKIALLAYCIDLAAQSIMSSFDLLPYSLEAGLMASSVLTPFTAFTVALIAYAVIGFAIYDLRASRAEFEILSRTDVLSGLANRRAFVEEFDRCKREKSLLVIDIDRFKLINDDHGHAAGDEVIVKVAAMLSSVFAGQGTCSRIGGEEFAVFSADLGFAEFAALGEIARGRIAAMQMHMDDRTVTVTVSGGITRALASQNFRETFSRADKALYDAKSSGRNRIVLAYETGSADAEVTSVDLTSKASAR